jgi:hypothetical protein
VWPKQSTRSSRHIEVTARFRNQNAPGGRDRDRYQSPLSLDPGSSQSLAIKIPRRAPECPAPKVPRTRLRAARLETVARGRSRFFAAGAVDEAAEEIRCGWCDAVFFVHQSCFRGHGYCSPACRREGDRRRCRRARDNYRKSVEAREDNRDRNREYRDRRRRRVMDHSSQKLDSTVKSALEAIVGVVERRVPRRGFVICAVCGGESRLIVLRHQRRRARDPP